jgi:hypothetical protein
MDNQENLVQKILDAANKIAIASRKGPASFIITNSRFVYTEINHLGFEIK